MGRYDELYAQLTDETRQQCNELRASLQLLGVSEMMQKRLLMYGMMGHLVSKEQEAGMSNQELMRQERARRLWQAVSYVNTHADVRARVKDMGSYLWTMAHNGLKVVKRKPW